MYVCSHHGQYKASIPVVKDTPGITSDDHTVSRNSTENLNSQGRHNLHKNM